jgi:alkanesulfonate monooxygenase SsuD/methylene tetrahydromethanopterin reductase-like flavin-dependent oxidoreductase (luciferase family)
MDLMTTVALPVVRGPVALAKSMAAIDILSDGRLVVGVGPAPPPRTTPP